MNFFDHSGGFGGPSRSLFGGGFGDWKADIHKRFGASGFSSQATAPELFSPPSGMSFGAHSSIVPNVAFSARDSMTTFSPGSNFGSSHLSAQPPRSTQRLEVPVPKSSITPRAATRSAAEMIAKQLQQPNRMHPLLDARNTARRARAKSIPIVTDGSGRHDTANEHDNWHHSEKIANEVPAGKPEIAPPKGSPEQAKSFCESAKAGMARVFNALAPGLASVGREVSDEEVITGDPVRDWEIRQQAGVQDVKTILTAATILAPGLAVGEKAVAVASKAH
jgi:hypothetical protein